MGTSKHGLVLSPHRFTLRDDGLRAAAARVSEALLLAASLVTLDWVGYVDPLRSFNITPWNPTPALAIVWMLLRGVRYAPIVFLALLFTDFVIRGAPNGLLVSTLANIALAGAYAATAWFLGKLVRPELVLRDARVLGLFVAVVVTGATLAAGVYTGTFWVMGSMPAASFQDTLFRFWLGDAVGIVVTAPLLLLVADEEGRRSTLELWRRPRTALQFFVMAGLIYYVFVVAKDDSKFFYPLFLPLIWIALRGGSVAAVLASGFVQIGVTVEAHDNYMEPEVVLELQALVVTFTITGLFLGVIEDERQSALEKLKRSLRLAAAGEMAGALAHELNQPLSALTNYGSACGRILSGGKETIPWMLLTDIIQKMIAESKRAADVVTRLRQFFQTGATQLESVSVESLLEEACRVGDQLNRSDEVRFRVEMTPDMPLLHVDRLQIELVLRNLIANAFEAVANRQGDKAVAISVQKSANGGVVFCVADTGEGISSLIKRRLFEPLSTDKAHGMGLGLAISRAIVEAHGGTLEVAETRHGQFLLTLPGGSADDEPQLS
jgi:two-component system, LuxR family, sensor kinase FixL